MTSTKNPSLAIGAFIVGAIALVFIALLFFSGGRFFAHKEKIVMYFDGSVQGLQIGAPIKLKGVVLGEITDIQINFQSDEKTVVTAVTGELVMKRINSKGANVSDTFLTESVKNGLRAQLNFISFLTGLLYVELDFYPDTPVKLYNLQQDILELPTVATNLEALSKTLQDLNFTELANNVNNFAKQANKIISSGEIERSLENFNRAAQSIELTSTNFNSQIPPLSKSINHSIEQINVLLAQLNTQTPLITNSVNENLVELKKSLENINQVTTTLGETFSEDAPLVYQFTKTLDEVNRSAQAFRNLSETLEQQPEALLRGKIVPKKGE